MKVQMKALHELRAVLGGLREFHRSIYENGDEIHEKKLLLKLSIQKLETYLSALQVEEQFSQLNQFKVFQRNNNSER